MADLKRELDAKSLWIWGAFHGKNMETIRALSRERFSDVRIQDEDLRRAVLEGQRLKKLGMKCDGRDCPICKPVRRGL